MSVTVPAYLLFGLGALAGRTRRHLVARVLVGAVSAVQRDHLVAADGRLTDGTHRVIAARLEPRVQTRPAEKQTGLISNTAGIELR